MTNDPIGEKSFRRLPPEQRSLQIVDGWLIASCWIDGEGWVQTERFRILPVECDNTFELEDLEGNYIAGSVIPGEGAQLRSKRA